MVKEGPGFENEVEESTNNNNGSTFGWAILIISVFVVLYDFVFIPLKRRSYLADCVVFNSMVINMDVVDSGTRQIFYDCYGESTTPQQVKQCWEITIPETASLSSEVINKCLLAPDYPSKILFD